MHISIIELFNINASRVIVLSFYGCILNLTDKRLTVLVDVLSR